MRNIDQNLQRNNVARQVEGFCISYLAALRTFARKFCNIDFFLRILPLKDDELVMSEMQKKKK